MTDPRFLLRTLGAFELVALDENGRAGERLLGSGKPLALLAFCASARDREHSRDALAALLWSDADPARARQSLRQALWRLRRIVGDALLTRDDAVTGIDRTIATDREEFLAALNAGDTRGALDVYRGPFLSGVNLPGGDEFDDWASLQRRHLEDQLVRAAEPFLHGVIRGGRPSLARSLSDALLQAAPDSVEAHRVAAECLLESGDPAAARGTADRLESLLRAEELRPSSAAASLLARLRESDVAGEGSRPSPLSLDLVGREESFATVLDAWRDARRGETRTILLIGGAGIGKSRLLGAVAERCGTRRTLCVTVRANIGERELPFGFAAAVVRALAALPGAAGVGGESAREIVALDPGLSSVFHASPAPQDGETVRRRALATLDLLTAIAEQEPLALFLDDLHWADPASRQLLSIVLGRATGLPLLVVGATRGLLPGLFDERTTTTVHLEPLLRPDVVDAIHSTGAWPDTAASQAFIEALASGSEGVPLQLVERLALVEERGLLRRVDGAWESDAWQEAVDAVSLASPIDHRIAECSPEKRVLLRTLAAAGAPIEERVLHEATAERQAHDDADPRAVDDLLRGLETRGLARLDADRWSVSHDVVAERSLALATPEERAAAHRAVGRALAAHGDHDGLVSAMRHLLLGLDDATAGTVFARIVARLRGIGDHRSAEAILLSTGGEGLSSERKARLLRALPLVHRVRWPHPAITGLVAALLVLVSGGMAWSTTRKPALSLVQAPLVLEDVAIMGPDVRKLIPSVIVTTREPDGRAGGSPRVVRVRSLTPDVQLLSADSALVEDGRASFGALRLRTTSALVRLQFEADGYKPVNVNLNPTPRRQGSLDAILSNAHVAGGRLNDQSLDGRQPVIRVKAGERIEGVVQVEYDAPWATASVWVSMTPTWGDPAAQGKELFPIATPVQDAVLDLPVALTAPSTPWRGWILFAIDAEPSGNYALSGTNWTVENAIWGDGNELAQLDDAAIRASADSGRVWTWRAFPTSHPQSMCRPGDTTVAGKSIRYCLRDFALAAVEVIVE